MQNVIFVGQYQCLPHKACGNDNICMDKLSNRLPITDKWPLPPGSAAAAAVIVVAEAAAAPLLAA